MATTGPPRKILFVHNGAPGNDHREGLIAAGYQVDEVEVCAVLAKALEYQPDLIVLDYAANGEVAAKLKNHDATKHIPIIALADPSGPDLICGAG